MPAPGSKPGNKKPGRKNLRRANARQAERQAARRAERQANRAEQQARAQYRPAPKPPGAPAVPAVPKYGPLMQRAQRDAQLRYGQEILRAQAQVNNAGTWFDNYKADVLKAQGAVADRYAAAQQALTVPVQGPTVSSPEGDQAAASRAMLQQAQQNALQAQGNAQQDYFAGRGTVGSAAQLQARQQATAQVNQLATEKDVYALSRRDELRDQRHQRRLENKAFGLDVAKAQSDAADKAADNARQQRENRQQRRDERRETRRERRESGGEVNQYGYTARQWKQMTTGQRQAAIKTFKQNTTLPSATEKGSPKYTANQQRDARKAIRTAVTLVKSKPAYSEDYYPKARDALVVEKNMDPVIAKAAVQLVRDGKVSASVAKALWRDYGVRVKPRKRTGKITPTQQPNQNLAPGPGGQVRPN